MLELRGRRVLVAGAGGFVGANLVRALHRADVEVVGLVRPRARLPRLADLEDAVELVEVDALGDVTLDDAVERIRPDVAVNLVVEGSHPSTAPGRLSQLETAVLGTARLTEALARVGCSRLVHLGSSLEYGPRRRSHREDDDLVPTVPRGVAKAAETIVCLGWARVLGLSAVVLRPFSIYGPWDHESRLVPTAIRAALEDGDLKLTEPGLVHDLVHIDDVVRAIARALSGGPTLDGKIFNIGTGIQTTNEELVALVGRLAGAQIRTVPGAYPTRAHDTRAWSADNERARTELGWTPTVSLEAGLRSTISWRQAREHAETTGR